MELQLQVTEEELLEFPEVKHNQISTSHTDNPAGKVVHSTEKKVATRIAVEAMEAVVQIHIPRVRLKNHTINDQ